MEGGRRGGSNSFGFCFIVGSVGIKIDFWISISIYDLLK